VVEIQPSIENNRFTILSQNKQIAAEEIVNRLKRGDQEVCPELYEQYSEALYGVALKIVRSEEHV
jgi:hypothetical protein